MKNLPDGICVKDGDVHSYIKGGKRYELISYRATKSWVFPHIYTFKVDLPLGGKLGFRPGTAIRNVADSRLYLIAGTKRLLVASPEALKKYQLKKNYVWVSNAETEFHPFGGELQ